MKNLPAYLAVVFLAVLLVGCGGGGGGGGGTPTVEPVSVGSIDGTTGVAADSIFKYVFSQAIDTSTVNSSTFFMVPIDGASADVAKASFDSGTCDPANAIAATVSCSSSTECTLTPATDLSGGTEYSICLTSTITYSNGQAFAGFTATFTTAGSSTAKAITSYSILGVAGVISESTKTIAVTVPYGTEVTALVATFSSTGASVEVGNTTQVSGTTANDFTSPVVYTVTAADSSTAQYTVTVTVAPNSAKAITNYSILGVAGVINESATTIDVTVPYDTDVTALVATFGTTGASVKVGSDVQTSGVTTNNFTSPAVYTVTAADGTTAQYTVTVTVALSDAKAVTSYSILSIAGDINESAKTIAVTVPYDTDVTALVATFGTTGASVKVGSDVQTSGVTANNFTSPVIYTVTAADDTTAQYTVTVTVELSDAKALTSYSILGITGTINESDKTIAQTVPYGTTVTSLVATFGTTGASVKVGSVNQASGVTTNSFSSPVVYTVTAADSSTAQYTVTVTVALNTAKAITNYSILGVAGTINEPAKTIAVTVPYGTSVTSLVATFGTTGASAKIGSDNQVSGVTANNFSAPVVYTVTAADSSTAQYTVTITVALNPAKAITSYSILGMAGVINESAKTIAVTVPYEADLTSLVATFETTGASVTVGAVVQVSGDTANNFTSSVTYKATAADSSTAQYSVTVHRYGFFAYVGGYNMGAIVAYSVNASTGALTEVSGSPFSTVGFKTAVAIDPAGRFLYVVSESYNLVYGYKVNATTGALTSVSGSPFNTGQIPRSITVDPSSNFVYIATDNSVSVHTINATTGALTEVSGSPFAAGTAAYSVTVDPSGKFAYVANYSSNNLSAYTINPTTGALTAISGSPFSSGTHPVVVTVDPSGRFAYVANASSANVSAYAINASTGALTEVSGSPFISGLSPQFIAVDPSGRYAYCADRYDGAIVAYSIDTTTGALTEIDGSPFATGGGWHQANHSVTVDPTGKYVYVTENLSPTYSTTDNLFAYSINSTTGALTALSGSPYTAAAAPSSFTAIKESRAREITRYSILGRAGVIDNSTKTISVIVSDGTDVTSLVATFTTSATSVKVGGVGQVSGVTANDFTSPVVYTVTTADSLTVQYIVTVTVEE